MKHLFLHQKNKIFNFFKIKITQVICNLHRKYTEDSIRNGLSELGIIDDEQPHLM
jgi:hypothetical protein